MSSSESSQLLIGPPYLSLTFPYIILRSAWRRLKPYAEAVRQVVSAVGTPCRLLDLQNDFITRLMHWADTMHDGFHLSTKGNVFIYKQVGEALRNVALNPSQLPMKRPPTLRATVTCWHDDMDGRYAKASRLT